jgi:CRISPR/Cas system-associated exonuclease Cas4 (RecB family)
VRYDFYLSYSGRRSYTICPKRYWYQYIIRDKTRGDPKGALFGLAIGRIFEWFYEKPLWVDNDPEAAALDLIESAIQYACSEKDFNSDTDPSFIIKIRSDLLSFVPATIKTIRDHHLLTVNSRSEVDLTVVYKHPSSDLTLKIGGRADFIHGLDNDVWLLDGKGSAWRHKYVDTDQVIWYAVQYYIKYHIVPSRLGFIYYRFPDEPIQWVSFDDKTLRNNVRETFEIADKIRLKQFDAKPNHECKLCDFNHKCEEGIKYLNDRRVESSERIDNSVFDLEHVG